ncbi:MAG TPA: type IV pilus modification protein PilV [Desulfonatronum sp.]|nr:type IV pilus modification protein PilV [Desulfonatronum sp.]
MAKLKQNLTRTHPAGFSLLEVLVGLIILAVGLLGLAGLQVMSLRQNNDAYLRSQATLMAYDILDRMRANRSHAIDGRYEIDFDESPASSLPDAVKSDLALWKGALSATLPGPGDGSIEMSDNTVVVVTIKWQEKKFRETTDGADTEWLEFTTQSEL